MAETVSSEITATKPSQEPTPYKEIKERENELLLPRIEDYPTKARVRVIDAHRVAVPLFQKAESLLDGLNLFVKTMEDNTEEGKAKLESAKSPTQEMSNRADEQIAKVQKESDLLHSIHERLTKGQDSSELLLTVSPLTGTDSLTQFTREQLAKNLKSGFRSRQRVRPLFRDAAHEARLRSSLQQQRDALYMRTSTFISATLEPIKHPVPQANIEQISPEEVVGKSQAQVKDRVNTATVEFWSQAREAAQASTAARVHRAKIKEWVEKSRRKLEAIKASTTFDSRLNSKDLMFAQDEKQFAQKVEYTPKKPVEEAIRGVWAQTGEALRLATAAYTPRDLADISSFMLYEWVPLEAVVMTVSLNPKIERSLEVGRKYPAADTNSFEYTYQHTTASMAEGGKLRSETNNDFPSSKELFWHVAPYDKMKEILKRGALASRKAQIDRYGESYFHSGGGIKTTKDSVIAVDQFGYERNIPKSEFNPNRGLGQVKNPNQEMNQVCFAQDWPYYYQDGIALIFSKASLCSKSQFFERDGWHLFSNYYRDNENSAGFEAELDKEPHMLIAVVGEKSEDLKSFLKNELGKTDQWIANNVVVVPSTPEGRFYIDPQRMQELFFSRHPATVKQGVFAPTGELGDHAGGGADPLYTYKALP